MSQIPPSMAISPSMDVTDYKSESGCKVVRSSIQPENRTDVTLTGGNTSDLYFAIHSKPNSFINGANTYLNFTYNLDKTVVGPSPGKTPGVSIANGSASSFIRTIEVQAGSTSLELIQNYNVIGAIVDDFNSADRNKTVGTILNDKCRENVKMGRIRSNLIEDRRICQPLLSASIGTLCDKYLPVGTDLGLRLRLTMEDPNIALVANTSNTSLCYTLKDITLEVEYIEVSPEIYAGIAAESKNVFKVTGTGIASFPNSCSSGSFSQSLLIPARYKSVRSFLTSVRKQNMLGSDAKMWNSVGARTRDNIKDFVFRIGGMNYPQLPISVDAFTGAEVFSELSKAWSAHASVDFNCVFNSDQFIDNTEGADSSIAGARQSAFLMGVSFDESGFSSSQSSGVNTIGGNVFLDLNYDKPCQSTIVDTFCFYDNVFEINCLNGTVKVIR